MKRLMGIHGCALLLAASTALAQDSLLSVPDADVEEEMAAMEIAEGFEINLFASDPMIANPIHMNWDAEGRLWVAGSAVYPHIAPGQDADDVITVLEDTDGDGVADTSTIFAEGLFIPTGILPGDGGVYVANSTELLHFKDTDGDLRADKTRVVLSGFGTEDTHHILHSPRWGHDGLMYFNQSIYIHSHIETPHGVRRLNAGGIWAFRPETMELEVFARGFVNPWGHHFDQWGQHFATDGAYGHGINYVFPGAAYVTAYNMPRVLAGLNSGQPKHCSLEILSGGHLPEDWRGSMVTLDFRGHRIARFAVTDQGDGYTSVEQPEILTSSHVSFRPVDVKMGPDGAIYIADWYNPIIQHGEVDFRDPRRDHEHGRIWRIRAKDRPLLTQPDFGEASIAELIEFTFAPEQWNQTHAKQELRTRDRGEVLETLTETLDGLRGPGEANELNRLRVLWIYQTLDEFNLDLLNTALDSSDYRSRAAGVRVLSEWKARLNDDAAYQENLAAAVEDENARVRLEAVRALTRLNSAEAFDLAMRAYADDMDRFLEYGLWTAARDLKGAWLPVAGELDFARNADALIYALRAVDSPEAVDSFRELYERRGLTQGQRVEITRGLAGHANRAQLSAFVNEVLSDSKTTEDERAQLLGIAAGDAQRRSIAFDGDTALLREHAMEGDDSLRRAVVDTIGAMKVTALRPEVERIVEDDSSPASVRNAAIMALAGIGAGDAVETIETYAGADQNRSTRVTAIKALLQLDVDRAAARAITMMTEENPGDPSDLVRSFLRAEGGSAALAKALNGVTLEQETAKRAERVVSASGRDDETVLMAIRTAGHLDDGPEELTPEEMAALVAKVQEKGNPQRGRQHFRKLDCFQCHALAGAGGDLGPDLTSIGASAQVDYLIEANYFPNKAIKEGYHSLLIDTKDGDFISGIKVTETSTELILRNATDPEIRIPLDTIARRDDGGSLMPTGLGDALLEDEFVDLVRYLSELGRTPEYSAGTERHVRSWKVLEQSGAAQDYLYEAQPEAAVRPHESLLWTKEFSNITGELPLSEVPRLKHSYWLEPLSFMQFDLEAPASGTYELAISPAEGVRLFQGDQEIAITDGVARLNSASGPVSCTVIVDRSMNNGTLDIQVTGVAD